MKSWELKQYEDDHLCRRVTSVYAVLMHSGHPADEVRRANGEPDFPAGDAENLSGAVNGYCAVPHAGKRGYKCQTYSVHTKRPNFLELSSMYWTVLVVVVIVQSTHRYGSVCAAGIRDTRTPRRRSPLHCALWPDLPPAAAPRASTPERTFQIFHTV